MPAPSAIRKNTRYSASPSMGIEISRPEAKTHDYHQRSSSRSRPVPLSRSQTPRKHFPDQPLERSRSNDRRYDDEYSTRDEYGDDLRDNNDDYSTIAEEEKPGGFGFSAKFFCCDSTMTWGISLGKEDEDTELLGESEKNVKRGIIPHAFPQRGRSLTRTNSFLRGRGRSLSRTDERRGRSHSRSRSFSGAIKGIMRSRSGGISPSRTRSWSEAEVSNHRVAPSQHEYFDDDDGTHTSNNHCSVKSSSKSTSTAKKFKGLFSKQSRKKSSNKDTAPSIAPTKSCDESIFSSLTETEVDRLKSQLEDLKKAEEERRRQAELLEVAMNATNEEEKRTFAEAAALAADAAAKALEDEETKRAAGALLAHQMEEDHKAHLDQYKKEDEHEEDEEEEISLDTTISKDSTTVETNVDKETVENNTSNVSTENGSEGTDSERNDGEEKKASELKEKKRKEEAAREKKASELKEKKAAQKVRREHSHLFLVSAFTSICRSMIFCLTPPTQSTILYSCHSFTFYQKERKRMAAKEKKAKKLSKKGQKKKAAKLAATEDNLNKDEVTQVCGDNEVVVEQPALLITKTFDEV